MIAYSIYYYLILLMIFSDPPIISTNQNWIHTGKKSTITLRCHVCAEKPYKVRNISLRYIIFVIKQTFSLSYLAILRLQMFYMSNKGMVDQRQRNYSWIIGISYSDIFRPETIQDTTTSPQNTSSFIQIKN